MYTITCPSSVREPLILNGLSVLNLNKYHLKNKLILGGFKTMKACYLSIKYKFDIDVHETFPSQRKRVTNTEWLKRCIL